MTGLLIKDWKLLKNQGRFYFVLLAAVLVISITGLGDYASFITSYITFLFSMFAISTFSYDDADNGTCYLMTLPVRRRTYVAEKYLFGFLLTLGSWTFATAVRLGFLLRNVSDDWTELLCTDMVYLLVVLIFLGYSFPIMLKFGAEKGRNVALAGLGILMFLIYLGARSDVDLKALHALAEAADQRPVMSSGILAAVCILILCISFPISLKIMEKKEF